MFLYKAGLLSPIRELNVRLLEFGSSALTNLAQNLYSLSIFVLILKPRFLFRIIEEMVRMRTDVWMRATVIRLRHYQWFDELSVNFWTILFGSF